MAASWKFPSNNKAGREGFNATGIAIFAGGLAQSFVREVIQNSLDAREDMSLPVDIDFSLLSMQKSDVPELTSLSSHLGLAQASEEIVDASTDEGRNFYKRAIATLDSAAPCRFLVVHDSNTTGLTGPIEDTGDKGQIIGGWLGLVKGSGITKKDAADALGSFGQGAKAPFAISSLRTVFYLTRTEFEGSRSDRFQGKSILQSMKLAEKDLSQATGFYGDPDELGPVLNSDIPSWAIGERLRVSDKKGTSLFIAEPHLPKEEGGLWFDITVAVISNFYFAIRQGNLNVTLGDGTQLKSETIAKVFDELNILEKMATKNFGEEVREGMQSVLTIHEAVLEGQNFGEMVSPHFGKFFWFLRSGEEVQGRAVGIARKSGMLITRFAENLKQFRGVKPFDLFICVTGAEGSEILRSFENPEHNKFQFDRVTDDAKRAEYVRKYSSFTAEIRELIKELAGYEVVEKASSDDLNHILGGYLDGTGSKELDPASRQVTIGKKSKRVLVKGEGVTDTTATSSGEGFTGGEGGPVEPGGSNPTDGDGEGADLPRPLSGSRIDSLRIVPSSELRDGLVKVTVFITGPIDGKGKVFLYKAGEVERQRIKYTTRHDRPLEDFQFLTFKKGNRTKHIWWVTAESLNYAIEGVVSDVA